ncbi:unnamed protein product [Polarella glacialis]|uniref:CCHC-type domain-containing protein n=1 Tax=Polarella glacialis TaxID=89957 RepID=A0A813DX44_POLGL|nr:unnamed protein product [Polarella glacialis]CAE8668227.1 unnamed protein product [Polarella glacialis]
MEVDMLKGKGKGKSFPKPPEQTATSGGLTRKQQKQLEHLLDLQRRATPTPAASHPDPSPGKGGKDSKGGKSGKGSKGSKGKGKSASSGQECFRCGRPGHRAAACRAMLHMLDDGTSVWEPGVAQPWSPEEPAEPLWGGSVDYDWETWPDADDLDVLEPQDLCASCGRKAACDECFLTLARAFTAWGRLVLQPPPLETESSDDEPSSLEAEDTDDEDGDGPPPLEPEDSEDECESPAAATFEEPDDLEGVAALRQLEEQGQQTWALLDSEAFGNVCVQKASPTQDGTR